MMCGTSFIDSNELPPALNCQKKKKNKKTIKLLAVDAKNA